MINEIVRKNKKNKLKMSEKFAIIIVIVSILAKCCINPADGLKFEVPRFYNQTDRQILSHLLNSNIYDLHTRPHEPTFINVSVIILTLFSPDESSLKYEVEFLLNQVWTDPRLMYDDGSSSAVASSSSSSNNYSTAVRSYPYLNALPVRELMWMPDTYFILHGEFKYPTDPMHMALKIYPNGTVLYTSR